MIATDRSEGLFRSAESLPLFKCVFLSLLSTFLLLILPVTLLLFLVLKVVTHLSGVLVSRVTLSDKGIMLRQQSIVFLFQLGGLRLQIALLRHFPFDVVKLDMLGNILVGFFKCVDSGSILPEEVLLRKCRTLLILLVYIIVLRMLFHHRNELVYRLYLCSKLGKLVRVVIRVLEIPEEPH